MKRIVYYIGLLAFQLQFYHAYSQGACGTTISDEEVAIIQKMLATEAKHRLSRNEEVTIPVKFHSFTRADGSGGLSVASKVNLVEELNAFFRNSGILFEHLGEINYIADDELFDFQASEEGKATVGNTIAKTINIYFFNTINSNGRNLCGYTRFPPSADHVFVAYSCVLGGNTTLIHELGHYFTLFHTHGTTNTGTTDELVNGSNCSEAGDRLCDTPADPNLTGMVNSSCAYTGNLKDANGDFYQPDPSNIMAYSLDQCQDLFTVNQYERIRDGFERGRAYLNFTTENFLATLSANTSKVCVNESVTFGGNAFGATRWEWTFEGGTPEQSNSQNPTVIYNRNGIFDVTLKAFSGAGDSAVVTRSNFVNVFDPLANALNAQVDYDFSSLAALNQYVEVNNPDQGVGFQYELIPFESDSIPVYLLDNFNYIDESIPNIDELVLPYYSTKGVKHFDFSFSYAYTYRPATFEGGISLEVYDSIQVLLDNSCNNEPNILYQSGGVELSTAPSDALAFVPSTGDEFKTLNFTITPNPGEEYLRLLLRNLSFNGNNFYLKSIDVVPDFSLNSPSNFRFVRIENDSLVFRWFDESNNELSFEVEESLDGVNFDISYTVPENTTLLRILNRSFDTKYYRIKALGIQEYESTYSETIVVESSILSNANPDELDIIYHPNPVISKLTFESTGILNNIQFRVLDLSGQILLEGALGNQKDIDMSSLSAGIYIISLNNDVNSYIKKIKIIKL